MVSRRSGCRLGVPVGVVALIVAATSAVVISEPGLAAIRGQGVVPTTVGSATTVGSPAATVGSPTTVSAVTPGSATATPTVTTVVVTTAVSSPSAALAPASSVSASSGPASSVPTSLAPTTSRYWFPPTTLPIIGTYRGPDRSRPADRLTVPQRFGGGSFRFVPPPAAMRAQNGPGGALTIALRGMPSEARTIRPTVQFALWLGYGTVPDRPVWSVVFRGVKGRRASAIPKRRPKPGVTTTTLDSIVFTDYLVVVDDATGRILVRSEFLS